MDRIPPLYAAVASALMTRHHASPTPHPNSNSIRQIENISFSLRSAPKRRLMHFHARSWGAQCTAFLHVFFRRNAAINFNANFIFAAL
ncbi:hypothetical protein [Paraburkholderia pallida]|uniref:Uncharacterized protein n=1 Tax=Paraburkholderia pallida TaxID=2547399 RepID=A0A4P7CT42_9BURK|nr:hypothetical protein [Paraburkholderia pallida]QBQ99130.1 hypothetical protein E1956_18090 [Paraburkholderia pallida]